MSDDDPNDLLDVCFNDVQQQERFSVLKESGLWVHGFRCGILRAADHLGHIVNSNPAFASSEQIETIFIENPPKPLNDTVYARMFRGGPNEGLIHSKVAELIDWLTADIEWRHEEIEILRAAKEIASNLDSSECVEGEHDEPSPEIQELTELIRHVFNDRGKPSTSLHQP